MDADTAPGGHNKSESYFIQICDFISYFVHLHYMCIYEKRELPKRVANVVDPSFIGRVIATLRTNNILNLKASSEPNGYVIYPK